MKNTLWANISWESFHYVCTCKCKTHFHPTSPHLPIPHIPLLNLYLNPNLQLLCKANYRKVILLPDWARYSLTGRAVSTLHHYREGHTDHPLSLTARVQLHWPGCRAESRYPLWQKVLQNTALCSNSKGLHRALCKGETQDLQTGQQGLSRPVGLSLGFPAERL